MLVAALALPAAPARAQDESAPVESAPVESAPVESVPVESVPVETGQTFRDWTVRCEAARESGAEVCYIVQNIILRETQERILNMAVGYLADQRPTTVLTLPLGVSLPQGVAVAVDGAEEVRVQYQRCTPRGCVAALVLGDELLTRFKGGREARVTFHNGARRPVSVPVSLLGFTAGFESLPAPP